MLGLGLLWILILTGRGMAQDAEGMQKDLDGLKQRVQALENSNQNLEQRMRSSESQAGLDGIAVILAGAFCALWAQNTGRNAWLWFFLGLIFNVIALTVLLYKNAYGLRVGRT